MYQLRGPVEAVRYTDESVNELYKLVKSVYPTASTDVLKRGVFEAYNGGANVRVEHGQWLVQVGGSLLVMKDEDFQRHFEPV